MTAAIQSLLVLSDYCLDAYRRFYPAALGRDALAAARDSIEVELGAIAPILGRTRAITTSRYLLHPERTGVFVCEPAGARWTLVTFLRFYAVDQYRTARRLWPTPVDPAADVAWVRAGLWRHPPRGLDEAVGNPDSPKVYNAEGPLYDLVGAPLCKARGWAETDPDYHGLLDLRQRLDAAVAHGHVRDLGDGKWIVVLRDNPSRGDQHVSITREGRRVTACRLGRRS